MKINKSAISATVGTLIILSILFSIGVVVYLAQHYPIAENILGWSLAAFGVFTVWMNLYNEAKIQEKATEWDSWGCR